MRFFAADQLDDLREEVQREMENALNQQRQGEPQGGREQQGNEPNPLGQAEEKTAKASRVRATRNPRMVNPETSSAAADRASQANRRSLVKAKDVAKLMSRRTIPSNRAAKGNSPVRANRRRVSPMDNLVPGRTGPAKRRTQRAADPQTAQGQGGMTESERPE